MASRPRLSKAAAICLKWFIAAAGGQAHDHQGGQEQGKNLLFHH